MQLLQLLCRSSSSSSSQGSQRTHCSLRWIQLTVVTLLSLFVAVVNGLDSIGDYTDTNAPATTGVLGTKVGGKRTLVLLDDYATRKTHSMFLDSLINRGHQLNYRLGSDKEVVLSEYGDYLYDNIVLFAPMMDGAVAEGDIMDFVNDGGNIIVAADASTGSTVRRVAALAGVDFDEEGTLVIDHFKYAEGSGLHADADVPHTVVEGSLAPTSKPFLSGSATIDVSKPVLFSGIGHAIDDGNILAAKVLTGFPTTYSASATKPITSFPQNAGVDTLLVTAVQARNNARMLFTGSLALFSNKYFKAENTGNAAFCSAMSKWAFAERGVLRAHHVSHAKEDGTAAELLLNQKDRRDLPFSLFPEPEIAKNSQVYRVKSSVTYTVTIEEYDQDAGGWMPYAADDVQMEFIMLDPYERITLKNDPIDGKFYTTFIVPDTYGIFKFRVMYRRIGYNVLAFSTQVSVRPYKHNEYERFITSAFPYYAGAFGMMIGFFFFTLFFLYSKDDDVKK